MLGVSTIGNLIEHPGDDRHSEKPITESTRASVTIATFFTLIGALALGGWVLRGYAEEIASNKAAIAAETVTNDRQDATVDSNKVAIAGLVALQQKTQWQIEEQTRLSASVLASQQQTESRLRAVENALISIDARADARR